MRVPGGFIEKSASESVPVVTVPQTVEQPSKPSAQELPGRATDESEEPRDVMEEEEEEEEDNFESGGLC